MVYQTPWRSKPAHALLWTIPDTPWTCTEISSSNWCSWPDINCECYYPFSIMHSIGRCSSIARLQSIAFNVSMCVVLKFHMCHETCNMHPRLCMHLCPLALHGCVFVSHRSAACMLNERAKLIQNAQWLTRSNSLHTACPYHKLLSQRPFPNVELIPALRFSRRVWFRSVTNKRWFSPKADILFPKSTDLVLYSIGHSVCFFHVLWMADLILIHGKWAAHLINEYLWSESYDWVMLAWVMLWTDKVLMCP